MKNLIAFLVLAGSSSAFANVHSVVAEASKRIGVPSKTLLAIACVESSCGAVDVLKHNTNGTMDVGIFQINSVHWGSTCREYDVLVPLGNALCAAKLLKMHMRYKGIDPMWPARYHSKTPSLKKRYWAKLQRWL